ncbi:equilibrative nucleoside transporter 1-like [Daphnia carinata]|uniref:equilibrative nucleoside transporter 1-like n=1 Tax=Daphnia carinata TaxID=120202 RepID=UPI00257F971E|nr:equilibrative nucleoside transporter 1-like [Daphnia carinata]
MPKNNSCGNGAHQEDTDLLVDTDFIENSVNNDGRIVFSSTGSIQDEENDVLINHSEPVDRYFGVYILFYLLGMATLLPWNFFITANGYWMYKLRDLNTTSSGNTSHLSPLQLGFTSYLCVTSLVPSTVVLVLNAFVGHKFSFKLRIAGGLLGVVLLFTFTTALVELDTDPWQMSFYFITLVSAFFINVVSSIFQGGVCGLAGKFPSGYVNAVISGQALGGIFASLANIVSIAVGASPTQSAFLYFMAADFTLVLSFCLYMALSSTKFFVFYSHCERTPSSQSDPLKASDLVEDQEDEALIVDTGISYRRIIVQIWPYLFSITLVYIVTLSLFPAVSVLIRSASYDQGFIWNDVYFTPVACFLLMSIGDYIGRTSTGIIPMPSNVKMWTCILSVMRLAFIPLMIMCNAQPRFHLPVLIPNDAGFVLVMALFAFSNGYLSVIPFAQAPRCVDKKDQETASSLMAAGLGIGLAVGGALSSVIVRIL